MKEKRQRWMIVLFLVSGLVASKAVARRWSLVAGENAVASAQRPAPSAQSSAQRPFDIATYVPLDNRRTWTYQWTVRYADGRQETTSRTKSFEGPEFLSTGYAYKFVSDLGDYVLLSVDNQQLRMHGSAEPHRGIRFTFDPPVVLYSPDMEFGQPYTLTQQTEDGTGTRTWTAVVEGFEDVNTPMGKFHHCLKMRLEMNSAEARTKAVYYYASGLGLVAYQYEAWVRNKAGAEIAIDAGLKLAQLAGQTITSASQLEALKVTVAAASRRSDDPEARKLFRQTYDRLYFWPAKFPGFQADFALLKTQDPRPKTHHETRETRENPPSANGVVRGTIIVTPDFKMKVNSEDKRAGLEVETEMSQFITHLKDKPFDTEFRTAVITFGDRDPVQGSEIQISAENTMGTSYRVKDGQILQIGHSFGRVRFLVNHTDFMKTDDGRLIPISFNITYYSNETDQIIGQVDFKDEYSKVENVWLPKKRVKTETTKQGATTLEVEFTNHRLSAK